uniref:putative plastid-specific 30S ribosomal protein n=1 Tax=Microzonia abyssicola TaxID=217214 RepID=UPI002E77482D|nr:putative plastid-specific 30S ribosomal protein [Syringoderma abyssicola]WAM65072.1 putative plastid-specific 30S ribosomal protein [Syringoderma abyssicola]
MNEVCELNKNIYVFKIIWGKSYIGLAIDKKSSGNIIAPITTFFFWPRENGWELLKGELSHKPWISKEDTIDILNGYNIIINYWLYNVNSMKGIKKLVQDSSKYNFELLGYF